MEVGEREIMYLSLYTVTTRMTSALRWAAMRAILMFHNCEGQSHKTVSTDHDQQFISTPMLFIVEQTTQQSTNQQFICCVFSLERLK